MSHACTLILMGVTSPVSEILLHSETAYFPFPTMDYSPWSSKKLIDRNWLKKFMHVGIDVKFMHTNSDGCALFGFGDIATFKQPIFPFRPWTIVHDHQKFNPSELAQKIHACRD